MNEYSLFRLQYSNLLSNWRETFNGRKDTGWVQRIRSFLRGQGRKSKLTGFPEMQEVGGVDWTPQRWCGVGWKKRLMGSFLSQELRTVVPFGPCSRGSGLVVPRRQERVSCFWKVVGGIFKLQSWCESRETCTQIHGRCMDVQVTEKWLSPR